MKCSHVKILYAGIIKNQIKAFKRAEWLTNKVNELQNNLSGEDKEKNYGQMLRLLDEIEANKKTLKAIEKNKCKLEKDYNFLITRGV